MTLNLRTTNCIACNGSGSSLGEVPFSYHFLQHQFTAPVDTGSLYKCSTCGLWFKSPYFTEERLAKFYLETPDSLAWDSEGPRPDFDAAMSEISKSLPGGGSVLDFGCYNGNFLRSLPDRFTRHGIEPSAVGAQAAEKRAIEIIGKDVADLGSREFDCITTFDVFEHLLHPLKTLDMLFERVRPGGLLCVGTGFADSLMFRMTAAKYYYVCMPEHVCFLTGKFVEFLGNRYGAQYKIFPVSRNPPGLGTALRTILVDSINLPMLLLRTKNLIRRCYFTHRLRVISSRGMRPLGRDHVVVVFSKPLNRI